jgi:hypothetical protein
MVFLHFFTSIFRIFPIEFMRASDTSEQLPQLLVFQWNLTANLGAHHRIMMPTAELVVV